MSAILSEFIDMTNWMSHIRSRNDDRSRLDLCIKNKQITSFIAHY